MGHEGMKRGHERGVESHRRWGRVEREREA